MPKTQAWDLPPNRADPVVQLPSVADSVPEQEAAEDWTWLDTFDWRLERAGFRLFEWASGDRTQRILYTRDGGEEVVRDAAQGWFADKLPSAFRERLACVMEARTLLPLVVVHVKRRQYALRDERAKIVARLHLYQANARQPGAAATQPLQPRFEIEPLKGYGEEAATLGQQCADASAAVPASESLMVAGLTRIGREPRDYTSKIHLHLAPDQPAAEATRSILRYLLHTLEANEAGARAALDSEFLHDFRVAVRRTRSALGQIKGALPPAARAYYRAEFAWLQQATGPARDLDVYLLEMPTYEASLAPTVRDQLAPLRSFLEERRQAAYHELIRDLDSERYRQLVRDWRAFLEQQTEVGPKGDWSARALADRRLWKMYRRLIREGEAITPDSPAEDLHEMRKTCKKLRYLMEFFRRLYPAAEIEQLIKPLKRLQENLGDFHDLHVQGEALETFGQEMAAAGRAPPETLIAMGRLVADLDQRAQRTRAEFAERFQRFAHKKNRRQFRALFHG